MEPSGRRFPTPAARFFRGAEGFSNTLGFAAFASGFVSTLPHRVTRPRGKPGENRSAVDPIWVRTRREHEDRESPGQLGEDTGRRSRPKAKREHVADALIQHSRRQHAKCVREKESRRREC